MLTIPRDTYLALVGMKSSTLDQRVRTGEAAWAFGVTERPTHGEYFVLDAVATILSSMLSRTCGLTLRQSTEVIRVKWDPWLELVTKAERWLKKYPTTYPMLAIGVAWMSMSYDESSAQRRYRILLGEVHKIIEEAGPSVYSFAFISIGRALSALKANAKNAGIELPGKLTLAQGEPGFAEWREEIRAYQQRAGMRVAKVTA
jgi:hypothetical protein